MPTLYVTRPGDALPAVDPADRDPAGSMPPGEA